MGGTASITQKQNLANNRLAKNIKLRLIKSLNVFLITVPFVVGWYQHFARWIVSPYYRRGNWMVILIFCIIYTMCGRIYDAFLVSYNRISEMIYSQALAALEADGIMLMITWLLGKHFPAVWVFLLIFGGQLMLSAIWCLLAHYWYYHVNAPRRTFIVWDRRRGIQDLIDSYGLDKKFNVVGNCPIQECLHDLDCLKDMQVVFIVGVHSHDRNIVIKYCVDHGITSFIIPRVGDVLMSGARPMHMFHLPMLRLERYNPAPEYLFIKRTFDILLSLIAILILWPVMLVTAILIKKTDGGPVFYRQTRLTQNGKEFDVLKFRSMRVDAEKDGVARLSSGDKDDRITPVGRVIRKVRIDELPQLFNILRGDMAIVGPRPERPEIAAEYEKEMPEFRLRLQAKCGLTGYAQVYGKYNTTPYDKLQMDLMYIANPSLAEDFKIILATVKILFLPESTEGVAEGQVTARDTNKDQNTAEQSS